MKIDKNVPIPSRGVGIGQMEIGDSIFFPGAKQTAVSSKAYYYTDRHDWKFATRNVTENEVKGIRLWRTG